ncbi:hypothetical protein B0H14DRAFT_1180907 [Mycena olivaceomarginata]|nr:hypothetical protein B0H14DRAFT_1180907 [Mycena olivaceomarginata]
MCSERLSALLSATAGASLLESKRSDISVYEAESRHAWDSLLYHFYVANNEVISPYVLLEHTIHFARNVSADQIGSETFGSAHQEQMKCSLELCLAAYTASLQSGGLVRDQALAALNQASELLSFLERTSDDKLKRLVQEHSGEEPRDGKTDAILFTSLPMPAKLPTKTGIIRYTAPSKESKSTAPPDTESISPSSTADAAAPLSATTDAGKYFLQNPFYLSTLNPEVTRASPPAAPFKDHLLLPHATVEYKKAGDTEGKALNQGRMYLVSVVSFYSSALGISNFPFYCLVTSGALGAVLMGWHSSKENEIYVLDRNTQTFNIAFPLQAFHFATFLLRLRDNQAELTQRIKDALKDVDATQFDRWRKLTQIDGAKQVTVSAPS